LRIENEKNNREHTRKTRKRITVVFFRVFRGYVLFFVLVLVLVLVFVFASQRDEMSVENSNLNLRHPDRGAMCAEMNYA